jgi:hypothetical protein
MPRTEKPLDPLSGPVAAFAHDLRALREKAGCQPYRALARRAGFSASTLSIAASGNALPSLDVTLAYVQACGGDPELWRERWQTLTVQLVRADTVVQPSYKSDRSNVLPTDEEPNQESLLTSATTSAAPVKAFNRSKYGIQPRSRILTAGAALLFVFGVATGAICSLFLTSQFTANTLASFEINELYALINDDQAMHSDNSASTDPATSGDQYDERDYLITAYAMRKSQADQVSQMDVSQVPDGSRMALALYKFWSDRAAADAMLVIYGDNPKPIDPAFSTTTIASAEVEDAEGSAQEAGTAAVDLWNSHAQTMGKPRINIHML